MKIEDNFVPYELALKLEEKGYNIPFRLFGGNTVYYVDGSFASYNDEARRMFPEKKYILAPLYQQVVDWFREKHDIHIHISRLYCYVDNKPRTFDGWCVYVDNGIEDSDLECNSMFIKTFYPTYYEALTKAIEEALKLI